MKEARNEETVKGCSQWLEGAWVRVAGAERKMGRTRAQGQLEMPSDTAVVGGVGARL